ncbi:hypothetical protein GIB67_027611, partial [Kingdonia uniflora]
DNYQHLKANKKRKLLSRLPNVLAYIVYLYLPLILFFAILAIACYLIGRARGRAEGRTVSHIYGPPVPAPPA